MEEESVTVDIRARKEQEAAEKEQDDRKEVDIEYREEFNKWRSLEESEAILADKRKALDTGKNEQRIVIADNDFEDMKRVAKKKPEEALLKSEPPKVKKKESLVKEEKYLKVTFFVRMVGYRIRRYLQMSFDIAHEQRTSIETRKGWYANCIFARASISRYLDPLQDW